MIWLDILWLCVMFYLSHTNGENTARQSKELHRITGIKEKTLRVSAHLICYMILGVLWGFTVENSKWLVILILIAVIDEGTKRFVKGRHTSYQEMVLNILGAAIGVGIYLLTIKVMVSIPLF